MLRHIASTLNGAVGWRWPAVMLRSVMDRSAVMKKTRWGTDAVPDAEARYAKQFSLAAATYLNLTGKIGEERALETMRALLVPIGCAAVRKRFHALDLSALHGMDRLMAFNARMEESDEARFNDRQYITKTENTCHYVIRRCVVSDFFSEAGTPELTKIICDVDRVFYADAFPDFTFDRGGSWENTIACGKARCEFVLRKKG